MSATVALNWMSTLYSIRNSVEQSIKNRFNDKRGGFEHSNTRKAWVVYPLAAILIDKKLDFSWEVCNTIVKIVTKV